MFSCVVSVVILGRGPRQLIKSFLGLGSPELLFSSVLEFLELFFGLGKLFPPPPVLFAFFVWCGRPGAFPRVGLS